MSANIHGEMVYSFEQPMWHGITEPSIVPMSAEEVMNDKFGGGFEVFTRPITLELNGEQVETGDFGVVRGKSPYDQNEVVLGYCTDRFHPLQPMDVAKRFDESVNQHVETIGVLGKGEQMFVTWKLPSIEVVKDDAIDLFGCVKVGWDTLKGANLFTSAVRIVCQNTLNFAESWAKQNTDGNGKGEIWKGRGVNKNLLRDLGYWMEHVQGNALNQVGLVENFFELLTQKEIKNDIEAKSILNDAYPDKQDVSIYYPRQLKGDKLEKIIQYNQTQERIRGGIYELFAGAGTAITPDYYGMMNATTEFLCHVMPSKKPIAESVMFGGRQKLAMQMVNTLTEWAK